MKFTKLHAAMVAATAFASTGAFAGLNLNGIDTTRATDAVGLEITISGATAQDNGFQGVFEELCEPGTLSVYTDRCSTSGDTSATCATSAPKQPGSSYGAYFCTMTSAKVTGLSAPTNVLVRKRSAGGSGQGVQPVADAAAIAQMQLTPANCKVTGTADVYKCSNTVTENVVSDAGISDEEPALFVAPNVPSGFTAVTPTQISRLNAAPMAALTFGIPVTNALYAALQVAQGLNPDLDGDLVREGQSETADAADIEANMPSLTREQVASLMKGATASWANFFYNGTALTATPGVTAPSDSRVNVCRRVNGSGTQAQLNALFLNVPCSSAAEQPAVDNTSCTNTTGGVGTSPVCTIGGAYLGYEDLRGVTASQAIIHENSGSGNVENCLNELQDNNRWAIGVQSLEKVSTKSSFIKLNGVSPTLANVATGNYFDWAATSMQWRNTTVAGIAAPTGNELAVLTQLRTDFAKASILNGLNDAVTTGFGPAGFLSLTGATRPFNENAPVMQYTRGTSTCNVQKARGAVDGAL